MRKGSFHSYSSRRHYTGDTLGPRRENKTKHSNCFVGRLGAVIDDYKLVYYRCLHFSMHTSDKLYYYGDEYRTLKEHFDYLFSTFSHQPRY